MESTTLRMSGFPQSPVMPAQHFDVFMSSL
jgi:hypothetical protein